MQHIEPASLSSLPERVQYLKAFLGFTHNDADALHAAKLFVAPLIPTILDLVYTKLLSFDMTAQSFVPRQSDYVGLTPSNVKDLNVNHPQIAFRKTFLQKYLVMLVTADYDDEKTWEYLDKVGIMHTGQPGFAHRKNKPELRVEYIHMGLLLGKAGHCIASGTRSANWCRWQDMLSILFWEPSSSTRTWTFSQRLLSCEH